MADDSPDPTEDARNEWDPESYDDDTGFVHEYGGSVVESLDPRPGEAVLDLGCGTGHLTADIAERVGDSGVAVGVDASTEMVERARETYPNLRFAVADAREYAPDRSFDAAFSNAALHWIPRDDQPAVAERVAALLEPGGRFVAELGGSGNVSAVVDATLAELRERGHEVEHPWYFPTVGEHAAALEAAGFEVRLARLFDRPTELDGGPEGLANWLDVFGDSLFAGLDESERAAAVSAVEDRLRDDLFDADTGTWTADYRRLRFVAVRE
ncbi:class I SAM-dependent methyltransferase [Halosimplex pelagicum]|uniref:Methyltransferase domain-containing protein n=1 Tax=Halosimplex pelagicum TaxID=869886 RepID=A0A7D5P9U1_9EURY|nr:methyltransferase domain-containing protein [Halosimplex pelagicum]QLH80758.1 methyltransferase domain-containing protein [Halosimplex pelagicum]